MTKAAYPYACRLHQSIQADGRLKKGLRHILPPDFAIMAAAERDNVIEAIGRSISWNVSRWTGTQLCAIVRNVVGLARESRRLRSLYTGLVSGLDTACLWPAWPCLFNAFKRDSNHGLVFDCLRGAVEAKRWTDAYNMCNYMARHPLLDTGKPRQGLLQLDLLERVVGSYDVNRQTRFCVQFAHLMRVEGTNVIEGWSGMSQQRLNQRRAQYSFYIGILDTLARNSCHY